MEAINQTLRVDSLVGIVTSTLVEMHVRELDVRDHMHAKGRATPRNAKGTGESERSWSGAVGVEYGIFVRGMLINSTT